MSTLITTLSPNPDGSWTVVATVGEGGTLPMHIFLYDVTPEGVPNKYQGITDRQQLSYRKEWNGAPIVVPSIGSAFVRTNRMEKTFTTRDAAEGAIQIMVKDTKALSIELQNIPAITVEHNIP